MKKFYITGLSGVGKSTVSEALNQRGIYSIDIDAIPGLCSWRNRETNEKVGWQPGIGFDWLHDHGWICNKEKLIQEIEKGKDIVIVVGAALNQKEYFDLFDRIFILQCQPEVFMKRVDNRTDNDFGKHISEKKYLQEWYESSFEKKLLEQGAIPINAERPVNEIVEEIISKCV